MSGNTAIWVLVAFCLGISFLLSGMEAGVFALSRLRIRQQMRTGRQSARVLHQFLEHPENFLWTILVGNTVANFIILGWLVVVFHEMLGNHRFTFVLIYSISVFLFYAFFDLLPKMLFRVFPNRICLLLARPFRMIHLGLRPLVAVVEWFSSLLLRWRGGKTFTGHLFGNREELRLLMQESAQGFTSEERAMINRVLDLQAITVRQAMKPLTEVVKVTLGNTIKEVLAMGRERQVVRFPVWGTREGKVQIVGILGLDALLYRSELDTSKLIDDHVKSALYLEEDLRLEVALRRMQRGGQRLAIVLGRDRSEIGILTLQDVLKVIFGEVSI